jgi:hypothetical protein
MRNHRYNELLDTDELYWNAALIVCAAIPC